MLPEERFTKRRVDDEILDAHLFNKDRLVPVKFIDAVLDKHRKAVNIDDFSGHEQRRPEARLLAHDAHERRVAA